MRGFLLPCPVAEAEVPTSEPQWIQTKGPQGGNVSTLFVASNAELYAGSGTDLYKLANDGQRWNRINRSTPFEGSWQIIEHGNTLYVISDTEVFASVDSGETWDSLGLRPEGHLIGSAITDEAFYLGLVEGVFGSTDTGKSWTPLNDGLADKKIRALAAVENTLFVGTDSGLYRLDSEEWKPLPVDGDIENIRALASSKHRLYVIVGEDVKNQITSQFMSMLTTRKASLSLYRSTDLGDSWRSIAPESTLPVETSETFFGTSPVSKTEPVSSVKMVAHEESLLILESGRSYYSTDTGETWTVLHSSHSDMDKPPVVVMATENIFYRSERDGCSARRMPVKRGSGLIRDW